MAVTVSILPMRPAEDAAAAVAAGDIVAGSAASLGISVSCVDRFDSANRRGLGAYIELAKPRITRLVTMTAAGGFGLSLVGRGITWSAVAIGLVGCIVGTALASAGANAMNQCMEVERDGRMNRTRGRPLPSGRVSLFGAVAFGVVLSVVGPIILLVSCGPSAALVCFATVVSYLLWYTPLKPVTSLNTWVGAVPGALPPLIGWCACAWIESPSVAAGLTEPGGWTLFVLMFVWQIPHFLAIAWMHKDDYARGGYRMLPLQDAAGTHTVAQIIGWAVLLVGASVAPWWFMPERLSIVYAAVAGLSSLAFLAMAARLTSDRSAKRARKVFIASIIHLPILLVALVVDATVKAWS